jgi:hypothetical protein
MTYTVDPRVDAFIGCLPDWQQATCGEVHDLVHAADVEVTETIKRTNRPCFVLQDNICAPLAAKDHVNVFLYDGVIVPDPRESSPPAMTTRPPALSPSASRYPSLSPQSRDTSGCSRQLGRSPAVATGKRRPCHLDPSAPEALRVDRHLLSRSNFRACPHVRSLFVDRPPRHWFLLVTMNPVPYPGSAPPIEVMRVTEGGW